MRTTPYGEPSSKEIDALRIPPTCPQCGNPTSEYGELCHNCTFNSTTPMTLNDLPNLITEANITDPDWAYMLVQKLPDYHRGYFDSKLSQWNESYDFTTEAFREAFLSQVESMKS